MPISYHFRGQGSGIGGRGSSITLHAPRSTLYPPPSTPPLPPLPPPFPPPPSSPLFSNRQHRRNRPGSSPLSCSFRNHSRACLELVTLRGLGFGVRSSGLKFCSSCFTLQSAASPGDASERSLSWGRFRAQPLLGTLHAAHLSP